MATKPPPSAYLTAGGAVAVALVSALLTVSGPWQPVSVMLGWTQVAAVSVALIWGRPPWLAAAAGLHVVRVGVHGIAGGPDSTIPVAALFLILMVELGGISFDLRQMPVVVGEALGRAALLAGAGGVAAGLTMTALFSPLGGPVAAVGGLAAAIGATAWLLRAAPSSQPRRVKAGWRG